MRKTVAYLRVSTDDQTVSIDAQRVKAQAYALAMDLEIVAFETDQASGKSLNRQGLQRALALLEGDVACLLVCKLDRLTRSVRDLDTLLGLFRDGTRSLVSVSDHVDTLSASGRLVLGLLTQVAQWERETIGERTSAAMAHLKASGRYCGGGVPLGSCLVDGAVVPCPEELAVAKRARALRDHGLALRAVAATLNAEGRTLRGKRISVGRVQQFLKL